MSLALASLGRPPSAGVQKLSFSYLFLPPLSRCESSLPRRGVERP